MTKTEEKIRDAFIFKIRPVPLTLKKFKDFCNNFACFSVYIYGGVICPE